MSAALAVALGGAIGAVGRYLMAGRVAAWLGTGFPWGTLAVNVLGGFVMGLLTGLMALAWAPGPAMRAFLVTGILGGFTTFSAFSLETALLIEGGRTAAAGAYVAASVVLGVLALFAGLALPRAVLG